MISNKKEISNGVFLSTIKTDKFKAETLSISITLPVSDTSLAYNLILSGLLRRGTEKYPNMGALNRALDDLYGSYIEIKSTQIGDNISFIINSEFLNSRYISENIDILDGVIDIISQILLFPCIKQNFHEDIFDQEKQIVLDSLDSEKNNTRSYAIRRCLELLYKDSYPTLEKLKATVSQASLKDIISYYDTMISSAPIDIFYVGSLDFSDISERLAFAFSDYPYKSEKTLLNPIIPKAHSSYAEFKSEKMPVSQGKIAMCFNSGVCVSQNNKAYYIALLLNEIFGGYASSRLFLNVREKMGLCYYCSSSFSIYTGIITVSSGFECCMLDTLKSAIISQLNEIKSGNFSDVEIENAKKSLINGYKQLYDNPFDIQSFYGGRELFGITDGIEECINEISCVTHDQIVELAKNISVDAVFFVEGTLDQDDGEESATDEI